MAGTADWVPADVVVERKASTASLGSLVIVEPDQDSGGSSPTLNWRPGQQPSESLGEASAQQGGFHRYQPMTACLTGMALQTQR